MKTQNNIVLTSNRTIETESDYGLGSGITMS